MKVKLLGCMTALAALLLASCMDDPGKTVVTDNGVDGEEAVVTFTLSAENVVPILRSDNGPGARQNTIGKGTNIDMLIYAVYDEDYNLLTQYGAAADTELADSPALQMKDNTGAVCKHEGQSILYVGDIFPDGKKEITLRLMRNKLYHIAFWAQSSETEAFNTDDLTQVEVIYDGAKNNDELRDAFCKVENFSVSTSTTTHSVVLTRPMAQINVGTTGADYKNLLQNVKMTPNKKITYSQISLTGVSKTIDVVHDTIEPAMETPVTFGWNKIAAFHNLEALPSTDDDLLDSGNVEEFLYVDIDYDGDCKEYLTSYPTVDENGKFLTETFKYMSMCYALVPAARIYGEDIEESNTYNATLLSKVEVSFAEANSDGSVNSDEAYIYLTLRQVPVQRNWRTNILGGLANCDDDDPDDPSSIFHLIRAYIGQDAIFNGEYTTKDDGGNWLESTFPGNFPQDPEEDDDDAEEDDNM